MRKSVLLFASMSLAVLLVGGIAWAATIDCAPSNISHYCAGTVEDDTINGSDERDGIDGYEGNDTLYGKGGDDTLKGGGQLSGGSDSGSERLDDRLYGGLGEDVIDGQDGNDTIHGGGGHDFAWSGSGDDEVYGDGGPDYLTDTYGLNRVLGGDGRDNVRGRGPFVSGGAGDDFVYLTANRGYYNGSGTPEPLVGDIYGGSGDDLLRHLGTGEVYGGSGEDDFDRPYPEPNNSNEDYSDEQRLTGPRTLVGGTGSDSVWLLGRHDDTIHFEGDGRRDVVVSCGMGTDTVYYDGGLDVLKADNGCERRIAR